MTPRERVLAALLLAPTHILEPEVPWENVEAFVAAAKSARYFPLETSDQYGNRLGRG